MIKRHVIIWTWALLATLAVIVGMLELVRIGFGWSGAAITMYILMGLGIGVVLSAMATLRGRRGARILLCILLGVVAAYCVLFLTWVGGSYGVIWLAGAVVLCALSIATVFVLAVASTAQQVRR